MANEQETANQAPTHFAVKVEVFKAVHALLDTLPRGQVNAVATAFEQSPGLVIPEDKD